MDEFLFRYRADLVSVHDGDTVMLDLDLGLRVRVRVTARLYGPDPDGKAGLNAPGRVFALVERHPQAVVRQRAADSEVVELD